MSKEQERNELHRAIWQIANDLRGSVDGWDFKAYVLGMLFFRFISENLTAFIKMITVGSTQQPETSHLTWHLWFFPSDFGMRLISYLQMIQLAHAYAELLILRSLDLHGSPSSREKTKGLQDTQAGFGFSSARSCI